MNGLRIDKKAHLDFSANDWDLYTAEYDCSQAAREINHAIEQAYNAGKPRARVYDAALKAMRRWAHFGGMDSEPMNKLDEVMEHLFRKED